MFEIKAIFFPGLGHMDTQLPTFAKGAAMGIDAPAEERNTGEEGLSPPIMVLFELSAGGMIHILLLIAVIALVIGLICGDTAV